MSPQISVVIPAYNQFFSLNKVIQALSIQETNIPFEIIIVDDGSNDELKEFNEFKIPIPNKVYHQINLGCAAARNRGIATAEGKYIIFCDADRVPALNFIDSFFNSWHLGYKVSVGLSFDCFAPIRIWQSSIMDWESIKRYSRLPFYFKRMSEMFSRDNNIATCRNRYLSFLVGNSGIECSLLNRIGGFDESFTEWGFEHFEMAYRIQKFVDVFHLNREAKNYHIPHSRGKDFYHINILKSIDKIVAIHPDIDKQELYDVFINHKPITIE